MERRTKIVCTLGPASAAEETIDRLIVAGMNVARLNLSHGTRTGHAETLARVRARAAARGVAVAVLADLQGPKIRIGALEGGRPVDLLPGANIEITIQPVAGTAERLSTSYRALPSEVRPGDRLLLADGLIELQVETVTADAVRARVVTGGRLFERQGINLPGLARAAPSLTEKDLDDLAWALAQGVDYIAVSFVRGPEDIESARAAMRHAGGDAPLIAKLEKRQALERLDEILRAADGVMVARGDLGVELPPEEVPGWQKRIIAAANARLVPVITATQMLESMTHSPRPTRAEATDVANAIWDGTDAVMLSAETAAGQYPVEAVAMMDRIARAAEREHQYMAVPHLSTLFAANTGGTPVAAPAQASGAGTAGQAAPGAIVQTTLPFEERGGEHARFPYAIGVATRAVERALPDVAAVVAFTRDGATARLISARRPRAPVLALTDGEVVFRRLALLWGVTPVRGALDGDLASKLREAERAARASGSAPAGATLLVVGHLPPDAPGSTNFLTLHRLP